jgi:hypothetical protein
MRQDWLDQEGNQTSMVEYFEREARERTPMVSGSVIEGPGRGTAFIVGFYERRWYIAAAVGLLHLITLAIIWRSV